MNNNDLFIYNLIVQATRFIISNEEEQEAELRTIEDIEDELLRIRNQHEQQLGSLHHRDLLLNNIYIERVDAFVLESSIHIGPVNHDIFYEIFLGGPVFMIQPSMHPPPAYETHPYWTMEHPSLNDQSQNTRKLFKTHYRITFAAFNSLVEKLS